MQRLRSTSLSLAHLLMVVAGLVTFVAIATVLRDRSTLVSVVVAAEALDEGTPAGLAPFTAVEVAANDPLVAHYVVDGTDLEGTYLARPLAVGEPLLLTDLKQAEQAPGRRTISIPIAPLVISGLGLRIGDEIDVIATTSAGESAFVVSGVEIVRLPGTEVIPGFGSASTTSWVTIEVTDEQALAVAAAEANATVDLVRSSGASPLTIATERSDS